MGGKVCLTCKDKTLLGFENKKFVYITQQCFAVLPQVNFPANNLNFHSRWGWWDWIRAIFFNLSYFNIFFKIWGSPPAPWFRRPYTALQKQKKRTRLMGYHLFPRKSSNGTRVRVGIIQLSCKLDVNCYHALIREEKFQCLKVNNFQKWYFVTKIVLTYWEKKLS